MEHSLPKHSAHLKPSAPWPRVLWPAFVNKTQLFPAGSASSVVFSRNFRVFLASADDLPYSSRSPENRSSTFLLKTLAPSKLLPSLSVASTPPRPCSQWPTSWAPHDPLEAFTLGSQPYLSLTSAIIWGDFSVPFDDLSDTCNKSSATWARLLHGPSSLPQSHATIVTGLNMSFSGTWNH